MGRDLRQFICRGCPGKLESHKYRLWYARVNQDNPKSKCNHCEEMTDPVPRGEEEGVHLCIFSCSNHPQPQQSHNRADDDAEAAYSFIVCCRMQCTAPCYECRKNGEDVAISPHGFKPLRRIQRKTSNVHNCSDCNGEGNCPNMRRQHEEADPGRNAEQG